MEEVIRIKGNKLLKGSVNISGSKNLSVALIPAALLSRDKVTLYNVPPISDVYILIEILEYLHASVTYQGDTLHIDATNIVYKDLDIPQMQELRASYYLYGVLIGMFKHLRTTLIGGCRIGARPIDLHLDAFAKLGVGIEYNDYYEFNGDVLIGNVIHFEKVSVGATINAALLAVNIKGTTTITNAALEPEVTELLRFLVAMGADIQGVGEKIVYIHGGLPLHGCEFSNIPDRIEAGTYALIGASCAKKMQINNIIPEHLGALLNVFDALEVPYTLGKNSLTISKARPKRGAVILTMPYPGFPTDLQQPLTSFLSVSEGTSVIIESIYVNRFAHVKELVKMGANIKLVNRSIIIHGQESLKACVVTGKDLRGGASLVIASLLARGTSVVRGLKFINRGYENMVKKLIEMRADISLESRFFKEDE